MTTTGSVTLADAITNYEVFGITTTVDADAQEIVMAKGELVCRIKY